MRRQGNEKAAYAQFQRVGELAPGANISVTAQFDAAASLLAQKQWLAAAQTLNEFRSRNPGHQLSQQGPEKLYLAYVQSEQWSRAAAELENMGNYKSNEVERRTISLRAGELYEKAGQFDNAVRIYKTYVGLYPKPLEQAVEIRFKLAGIAKEHENANRHKYWLNEVIQADAQGGRERNDRTRFLAAQSALELAEPAYQEFAKASLIRPLKKSIKDKKEKMQIALKAYARAADYNIAEVTTACTYKIAQIYTEFGDALLHSQRPKGLNQAELSQYEVLLEEQAFPFEEKAIQIHETNVQRVVKGLYDDWVRKSYAALGRLIPARYAKYERSEAYINVLQ